MYQGAEGFAREAGREVAFGRWGGTVGRGARTHTHTLTHTHGVRHATHGQGCSATHRRACTHVCIAPWILGQLPGAAASVRC